MENRNNNRLYEQISEWLRIYRTSTNVYVKEKARTLIVSQMVPIVKHIARTIARREYDPVEDLAQAGFIGLLKAIENFDSKKNDNFRVYAGYLIIGEIKHYIRDKMNTIRVPRYIQELTIRINNFTKDLTPEEVNSLTADDMASALEVSPKVVDLAIQAERRRSTISLEEVYTASSNDSMSFEELIPSEDYKDREDFEDARIIFEDVIQKLPPDEKVIVDMYYKQDMSQKEIADALQLSQMNITRKVRRAFELMSSMVAERKSKEVQQ